MGGWNTKSFTVVVIMNGSGGNDDDHDGKTIGVVVLVRAEMVVVGIGFSLYCVEPGYQIQVVRCDDRVPGCAQHSHQCPTSVF